ncbi:MAG: helix-turn-helix transcriptional regulator [Oscillospiraceae bacterium]|nr:helix-turn-helix transcriptional regulator [Oscillospiraceae bacterium]
MDTVTAVRNRILELCGTHDISINKLANICALPPSSIKNILYGKSQNPKLLTIKKICDGLGITLAHFFDTPEFNALEQEIKEKIFRPVCRKSSAKAGLFRFFMV